MRNTVENVWVLFCLLGCSLSACLPGNSGGLSLEEARFEALLSVQDSFSLWIRHGTVIDGTGSPGRRADVLVTADTVAFIGLVDSARIRAHEIIDARGKVVTPGFIDVHAHGNPLQHPDTRNFLAMGVTSICLGQDGSSPDTPDLGDWMDQVDAQVPGTNVLMFVGHGTLRQLAGVGFRQDPSAAEIAGMQGLLERAMEAGCWGLTTGLEYTPGMYASPAELDSLAKVVGRYGGILMSHIRNEDDDQVMASIRELLRLGRYCKVQVSHIKSVYGKGAGRAQEILALLDSAIDAGIDVSADMYPYTASYTTIGIVFPQWARPPNSFTSVRSRRGEELAEYLRKRIALRNGPEATLFGTPPYAGKTLAQVAEEKGKPFERVLMEDIGPGGASAAYFVMDDELQEAFLQDSLVMICSDGSAFSRHPRGHGTFARIIETYVNEKQRLPLEAAIWKMSGLTAATLGLPDRGVLAPGKKADMLVFDPAAVREHATFENPFQLAGGFRWVFVGGHLAWQDTSEAVPHRWGRVLRKAPVD